jgi:hypothetical protein
MKMLLVVLFFFASVSSMNAADLCLRPDSRLKQRTMSDAILVAAAGNFSAILSFHNYVALISMWRRSAGNSFAIGLYWLLLKLIRYANAYCPSGSLGS